MRIAIHDEAPRGRARPTSISRLIGQPGAVSLTERDGVARLRAEHAHLSARAAQARGRGEWMLAAQTSAQMAVLEVEIGRASGTSAWQAARIRAPGV
jgi:hypothetical protein